MTSSEVAKFFILTLISTFWMPLASKPETASGCEEIPVNELPPRPGPDLHCLIDNSVTILACGDPNYIDYLRCQKAKFNRPSQKLPEYALKGKEELSDGRALVLLSGCVLCNNTEKEVVAKLKLQYFHPAGSLFIKCSDEWETAAIATINLAPNEWRRFEATASAGFSLGGKFAQRRCGWFLKDDKPPKSFAKVRLSVEHNCGNNDDTKMFELPEIVADQYIESIPELVGIKIDLDQGIIGKMEQSWSRDDSADKMEWANKKDNNEENF